jgi:hypothetical protein
MAMPGLFLRAMQVDTANNVSERFPPDGGRRGESRVKVAKSDFAWIGHEFRTYFSFLADDPAGISRRRISAEERPMFGLISLTG